MSEQEFNLKQAFQEHTKEDGKNFDRVSSEQKRLTDALEKIRDNHLAHIQADVAGLKADNVWVKRFIFTAAASLIGLFIEQLWKLIAK